MGGRGGWGTTVGGRSGCGLPGGGRPMAGRSRSNCVELTGVPCSPPMRPSPSGRAWLFSCFLAAIRHKSPSRPGRPPDSRRGREPHDRTIAETVGEFQIVSGRSRAGHQSTVRSPARLPSHCVDRRRSRHVADHVGRGPQHVRHPVDPQQNAEPCDRHAHHVERRAASSAASPPTSSRDDGDDENGTCIHVALASIPGWGRLRCGPPKAVAVYQQVRRLWRLFRDPQLPVRGAGPVDERDSPAIGSLDVVVLRRDGIMVHHPRGEAQAARWG